MHSGPRAYTSYEIMYYRYLTSSWVCFEIAFHRDAINPDGSLTSEGMELAASEAFSPGAGFEFIGCSPRWEK